MLNVTYKQLTLDDMDEAATVQRASFDNRLPWLAGLHSPEEDRRFYREHVFADCSVWGAYEGDALVGIVAFREGWVEQLYVLPEVQGQGVGSKLLEIAKATSQNLSLWTFQRNAAARTFYERRGFVALQTTDGAANEEREPDVLYFWSGAPRSRG